MRAAGNHIYHIPWSADTSFLSHLPMKSYGDKTGPQRKERLRLLHAYREVPHAQWHGVLRPCRYQLDNQFTPCAIEPDPDPRQLGRPAQRLAGIRRLGSEYPNSHLSLLRREYPDEVGGRVELRAPTMTEKPAAPEWVTH